MYLYTANILTIFNGLKLLHSGYICSSCNKQWFRVSILSCQHINSITTKTYMIFLRNQTIDLPFMQDDTSLPQKSHLVSLLEHINNARSMCMCLNLRRWYLVLQLNIIVHLRGCNFIVDKLKSYNT